MLTNQLVDHFESNKIFYKGQFGFRIKSDTFNEKVVSGFESGEYINVLFSDLSQAFDYVSHSLLLQKLQYYGITKTSYKLIKAYLQTIC